MALKLRFTRNNAWICAAAVALATLAVVLPNAKPFVHRIDLDFLHERLQDAYGQIFTDEDWAKAVPLPTKLDQSWLSTTPQGEPFYIAHALGASGTALENTYTAFAAAAAAGFRLYEVDISTDGKGRLRCHHGPTPPAAFDKSHSCTFDRLLPMIDAVDGWVVLDIKSEFEPTAEKILQVAKSLKLERRVIFQLYYARQLAWFAAAARNAPLPMPVITAYSSKRSANHIIRNAQRLGARVVTIPTEKLTALETVPPGLLLFTHPVHSCSDWKILRHDIKIDGMYATTNMKDAGCKQSSAAPAAGH